VAVAILSRLDDPRLRLRIWRTFDELLCAASPLALFRESVAV
jgi:hypothetical protein